MLSILVKVCIAMYVLILVCTYIYALVRAEDTKFDMNIKQCTKL